MSGSCIICQIEFQQQCYIIVLILLAILPLICVEKFEMVGRYPVQFNMPEDKSAKS